MTHIGVCLSASIELPDGAAELIKRYETADLQLILEQLFESATLDPRSFFDSLTHRVVCMIATNDNMSLEAKVMGDIP